MLDLNGLGRLEDGLEPEGKVLLGELELCIFLCIFEWSVGAVLIGTGKYAGLHGVGADYSILFVGDDPSAALLGEWLPSVFAFHVFLSEVAEEVPELGVVLLQYLAIELGVGLAD